MILLVISCAWEEFLDVFVYTDADEAVEDVYIDADSLGKSKSLFVAFIEHAKGAFGSRNVWKLSQVKFLTASFEKQLIEQYKES